MLFQLFRTVLTPWQVDKQANEQFSKYVRALLNKQASNQPAQPEWCLSACGACVARGGGWPFYGGEQVELSKCMMRREWGAGVRSSRSPPARVEVPHQAASRERSSA
mmetsp:Transcript_10861/g.23700  ORF Transcript_10861/g.23700 Transcript_10861/m.23700 type:complete len:107 (-) Transcript_10861:25-345(-)